MKILKILILYSLILLFISCSKDNKVSIVKEKNIETQMIEAFEEGYKELEDGDVLFAAKKFKRAEEIKNRSAKVWEATSTVAIEEGNSGGVHWIF